RPRCSTLFPCTTLFRSRDGGYMYFVHSYYCKPENAGVVLSTTRYGETEFCSSLQSRNIFACQFHPERSGPSGLTIYQALSSSLRSEEHTSELQSRGHLV